MMRSMYAGVSGLRNHQTRMDVIGNNIANVNTVGFKSGRVNFQDVLSQTIKGALAPGGTRGGVNAQQIGMGMNIAAIDVLQTQGNLQNTGKITDVAIQGDGFFILSDGARQYYTRAGNFNLDTNGSLTNASTGMLVQGWLADNHGVINTSAPITGIQLQMGQTIPPIATTQIEYGNNLNSNTNSVLSYPELRVSDGNGHNATVKMTITPISFNQYTYTVDVTGGTAAAGGAPFTGGTITLDNSGNISAITGGSAGTFTVTPASGSAVTINLPAVGAATGGQFNYNMTSTDRLPLTGFVGAGNYNVTVTDDHGNPVVMQYAVVAAGGNSYTYTASVVSGGSPATGTTTGSFDWTAAAGVTNPVQAGNTVVTSTAGLDVNISGPVTGAGVPSFQVASKEVVSTGAYTAQTPITTSTKVYDSLGAAHTITNTVLKTGVNTWSWSCANESGVNIGGGTLSFNNSGQLVAYTGGPLVFTPTGANPLSITPDFSAVTQQASTTSQLDTLSQDGYPMGQLESYNIDQSGKIVGVFSNGMSQALGEIALASFSNPAGLSRSGNTMFSETSNSGPAHVGIAGQNGRGLMTPGAVEMSNVDLSQEFTDMIVTQRGFQANSKIITTSDEMLQDLVNLKR